MFAVFVDGGVLLLDHINIIHSADDLLACGAPQPLDLPLHPLNLVNIFDVHPFMRVRELLVNKFRPLVHRHFLGKGGLVELRDVDETRQVVLREETIFLVIAETEKINFKVFDLLYLLLFLLVRQNFVRLSKHFFALLLGNRILEIYPVVLG